MIDLSVFEPPRFKTIVADPPWQYGKAKQETYAPGTAEREYETMTIEQIASLDLSQLVSDDAHLYLWVTNPKLYGDRAGGASPHDVLRRWGFVYKTMITWVKTSQRGDPIKSGMGYYFRGCTEHVLFATRGKVPIPPEMREPNVIMAPRSKHSSKPDEFFRLVERVSPGPRMEMFARRRREGWSVWGDEVESDLVISG